MNQKYDEFEELKKRIRKDKKQLATIKRAEIEKKNNQEEQIKFSAQKNNKNLVNPKFRNDKENFSKNFNIEEEDKNKKESIMLFPNIDYFCGYSYQEDLMTFLINNDILVFKKKVNQTCYNTL